MLRSDSLMGWNPHYPSSASSPSSVGVLLVFVMAADVVVAPESAKSCCAVLKERYSKLEEKRNALRQAVKLLEHEIDKFQTKNLNLKKSYEEEKARADTEREEKLKEVAVRVVLENEISNLKEGRNYSMKELLQKERQRGDSERKKAEAEKKKAAEAWEIVEAEKSKAKEERGLLILKGKGLRKVFLEEQRKCVEANRKKTVDEKSCADNLSQQLEEERRRHAALQKEINE
ncbi:hypothetical protein HHK36_001421 [Tetracentron sinense]|uniref:Uncharacterized protein n=1 Tax=Tetracentron sinense TaxID=13715 RepID=A0A834ZY41_TETSI|nr:hypothetical protein HHK36_001421 [Tetracentron sinense]